MFESDVQFADTAVGGADWCESGAQSPSRSPSWSSEESCRENGLPDVLHGVTSQRIRVRRPRATASEAAQALYNPEYQDPDGSSVLTNVSFVEREDGRSCAAVARSRARNPDRATADPQRGSRPTDPRTLKALEELADILACIFADAQATSRLDAPVVEQPAYAGFEPERS
jgi:hypothetical protein